MLFGLGDDAVGPLAFDLVDGRILERGRCRIDRADRFVSAFEIAGLGELARFFELGLSRILGRRRNGGRRGGLVRTVPGRDVGSSSTDADDAEQRTDADHPQDARALRAGAAGLHERGLEAGDGGQHLPRIEAGTEDLAGADEAQANVAHLERVARLDEAAPHLLPVDADAVGRSLVDDLVAPVADGEELGVEAAHRAVVDRDVRILGPAEREVILVEVELLPRRRPDDDDEAVGPVVRRQLNLLLGRGDDRLRLVLYLEPVVAQLDDVPMPDVVGIGDALAVDVGAVVAREIADQPTLAVPNQDGVFARDVPIGQTDGVRLVAADRVLLVPELKRDLLLLVVLYRELPHGS